MRISCAVFLSGVLCAQMAGRAGTLAQFRTPLGEIEVELFDSDKPITVENFVRYVQAGLYQDSFLHRWHPGFVVQGGGFYVTDRQTTNAAFAAIPVFPAILNEYSTGRKFTNSYGTIAMARVEHQTNSATSQWFFNLGDNSGLDGVDGGFTVFGKVVRGTNVLNRFNLTSPTNGIYLDPLQAPLNELPVLATNPTYGDLIYVDVSLLRVAITRDANGGPILQWPSVSNAINRVEFATQIPADWRELTHTNGTGQTMRITVMPNPGEQARFYRVRVDY